MSGSDSAPIIASSDISHVQALQQQHQSLQRQIMEEQVVQCIVIDLFGECVLEFLGASA